MLTRRPKKLAFRVIAGTVALVAIGLTLIAFALDGWATGQVTVRSRHVAPYIAYADGPFARAFAWNVWGALALGGASLARAVALRALLARPQRQMRCY